MTPQPRRSHKVEDDDFEQEVALVRQNRELMDLLDQRSRPGRTFSIEQARESLKIDGAQRIDGGTRP